MFNRISEFFMYLLAVYGALTIILGILGAVCRKAAAAGTKVKLVLLVKDVEETIEYIIRSAVKGDFTGKVMSGNSLTVVDMGSSDRTLEMLEKLRKDYECFDILTVKEKDKVFMD